jgi:DNA-binding LacI/PurR family transcriptional regulator
MTTTKEITVADSPDNQTLIDALRDEFSKLSGGSRLPTIREIAAQYGVSQFGAQRAFEALKEEGLIQSFVGRGSFTAGARPVASPSQRARVLIVSHATPSFRGAEIAEHMLSFLNASQHKTIHVSYTDVDDLSDLLGRGGFDICVLQPRRSILPVEALELLKSKAKHMIVEGRQLELMDVDVFLRNRAKSMAIALHHLRSLGHGHIGFITERLDTAAGYGEVENLFNQMLSADPEMQDGPVLRISEPDQSQALSDLIAEGLNEARDAGVSLPTAYIVSGRFQTGDIRQGFGAAGLNVPADASIVHLRAASDESRTLTTVGRSARHVAQGVVELVNWRLANPGEPSGLVLDDPALEVGESSRSLGGGAP